MQVSLRKISDYIWEIPKSFRSDMRVPARIFASDKLIEAIGKDRSLEQTVNVATLSGIEEASMAMPDMHEGYGFCIGGVAAIRTEDGIISPGGVGYDINCGVRLLRSQASAKDVQPKLEQLATQLQRDIPSGLGRGGELVLGPERMDQVLQHGVDWMIENGYGVPEDRIFCEGAGHLTPSLPDTVSSRAKQRGRDQLGTIGSGNHFVEVERIDEIFHEEAAKALGLFKDQVVILIHCGSRGLGHQNATDYIREMMRAMPRYGITLPDRELACAPFESPEGQAYYRSMNACANFAFANRQYITHEARQSWKKIFGDTLGGLELVYDIAHNMAKVETHRGKELAVHRKGATRAFGPGHPEIPAPYREIGQPVFIPGSMGTASYVLIGTEEAEQISFSTACHGAGRMLSRTAAARQISYDRLAAEMREQKIVVRSGSRRGLMEEAPEAYKDVEEVVRVVHEVGIAKRVARLKPIAVVKG